MNASGSNGSSQSTTAASNSNKRNGTGNSPQVAIFNPPRGGSQNYAASGSGSLRGGSNGNSPIDNQPGSARPGVPVNGRSTNGGSGQQGSSRRFSPGLQPGMPADGSSRMSFGPGGTTDPVASVTISSSLQSVFAAGPTVLSSRSLGQSVSPPLSTSQGGNTGTSFGPGGSAIPAHASIGSTSSPPLTGAAGKAPISGGTVPSMLLGRPAGAAEVPPFGPTGEHSGSGMYDPAAARGKVPMSTAVYGVTKASASRNGVNGGTAAARGPPATLAESTRIAELGRGGPVQGGTGLPLGSTSSNAAPKGVSMSGGAAPKGVMPLRSNSINNGSKPGAGLPAIPLAELQRHNKINNGWVAISGKVYDVSTFADEHSGGAGVIERSCGKDCTATFKSSHPGMNPDATLKVRRYLLVLSTCTPISEVFVCCVQCIGILSG
jgi:predicted heme/steroid binding protein